MRPCRFSRHSRREGREAPRPPRSGSRRPDSPTIDGTKRGSSSISFSKAERTTRKHGCFAGGSWRQRGRLRKASCRSVRRSRRIPSRPRRRLCSASLLVQQNEPDQAAAAFREALRLDPRHRQARLELSRLELAAGRTDASVSLAEQAIRNDPESVEGRLTLARGLTAQGDLARAEPIMERLVKAFAEVRCGVVTNGGAEASPGGCRVRQPVLHGGICYRTEFHPGCLGAHRNRPRAAQAE